MAKKVRRQTRRTTTVAPVSSPVISGNGSRTADREFNPDYSPVIKDLKRIGILAGTFFTVLIALAFILN
jgi:hypothetical protein